MAAGGTKMLSFSNLSDRCTQLRQVIRCLAVQALYTVTPSLCDSICHIEQMQSEWSRCVKPWSYRIFKQPIIGSLKSKRLRSAISWKSTWRYFFLPRVVRFGYNFRDWCRFEWHLDCGDVVEIETRCRIPRLCVFGGLCVDMWHYWYTDGHLCCFDCLLTIGTLYQSSKTVKHNQNTVKTAKMTIGVPIVTSTQSPPNTQSRIPYGGRLVEFHGMINGKSN